MDNERHAIDPPVVREFTVTDDWEPMPTETREYRYPNPSTIIPVCLPPIYDLIDFGVIEMEFRVKNRTYPDPRNRYWWRLKQPTLFDSVEAAHG